MKFIKRYIDRLNESITNYYTTTNPITLEQFIETEVEERENYDMDEVEEWIKKYNIDNKSKLLWITTKPWIAARYNMTAEEWDNAKIIYEETPNSYNVDIISSSSGIVIDESDDGDDGFLMILK